MKTILKNRFTGEAFGVPAGDTGRWYGSSNRSGDGTPMYEPAPCYRDTNPKIDIFDGNQYLASTNQFRTIRDARQFYETRTIKGRTPSRFVRAK